MKALATMGAVLMFLAMLFLLGFIGWVDTHIKVEAANPPYTVYLTSHNCVFISNAIPGGVAIYVVPRVSGPYLSGDNGC